MPIKIIMAKVVSGHTYQYLKDIEVVGRVDEEGDLIVFGCKDIDQPRFYQALLDIDKADSVHGWETVEEVKSWWEEELDMLLYIEKGKFEIVDSCLVKDDADVEE